ncbi:ABC transporter substrate-binding protein [Roseinatronobacter alkalisoli]|uniref:Extracellular solute-binding protein n=1 Tax=Roseinatronobacter alkalisoli TaxID=3028235 RepID=A0ABT5TCG5_9RHOB|nr:extracellular solute-binding protein [Roseinatronobacter sp. HJB301]MDD7972817.1 extracellular solute-binding protein [Roseinatronobacter sp. HJB301]
MTYGKSIRTIGVLSAALAAVAVPMSAAAELDTSQPVTLTITSTSGGLPALFNWAAESFQETYPNVTVEVIDYADDWYNQNAVRLFNSSDRPDLAFFWLTGFYHTLVDAGVLEPLDDFYVESGLLDVLPSSSVEVATAADGSKYGVSMSSIMSPLLMYNKTALAEAGFEGEPQTMEEFIAMGPALREAGYIPWTSGLANASQATQLFDINIRRHTDDETYGKLISKEIMDYTSPDIIEAFSTMQRMAQELMAPGAAGVENLEARGLFAQGRAAFYSDGSWNLGMTNLHGELPDGFDLGIMPYPPVSEGSNYTTGLYDANGLVIPRGAQNADWAKEFIAHILSYDVQRGMGVVNAQTPIRVDITADDLESYHPDIAMIYQRGIANGTHRLFNTIMPGAYRPAATQLIQGLVGGQLTPEEFAAEFTAMVASVH